ncbi:YbaK/EbsC family protein [Peptoniphilus sp. KCTC 25270]|uniref:YbaK/EbsC family protein n=1 Tax=Peptoniphilus sp. KCTC 25270 TaxID=2897414 RepID=UPI001E391920|nr:YbaK/EbsC family protein [Peptoniphilus sp. KCTC 25270]MCD1146528.1 YbaK/EbsC family protein [Peptoniphilus sp. KCTC 25270]
MSVENARKYLEEKNLSDHMIEVENSTATVALAAQELGVTEGEIAKSLTFWNKEKEPVLVLMAGDKKIDNKKFKAAFETKAKMLSFDEVEECIGHRVGGVCPFGLKEGVHVYLDESLKEYEIVYPAAGSEFVVSKFKVEELANATDAEGWVDVSK